MKQIKTSFGTTKNGEAATLYTFTNKNGMSVSFTDYGANIVNICVPDKVGNIRDIALGFDSVSGYEMNPPGFGSFIGRYANRIGGAKFSVNGKEYTLEKNDGDNCLHGGFTGYNTLMYETEIFEDEDALGIEFSRLSPDMEQGFPGNLDVSVTYTLTEDNELVIEYFAVSDKDTILNLTNHSYFNLAGHDAGAAAAMNMKLKMDCDYFTPTDDGLIPTGELRDVTGTPMDFRTLTTIGDRIDAVYAPLKQAGGYDHNYVLKTEREEPSLVAELIDEASGRKMEVYTDLPGMQFYAGNFIVPGIKGKGGCAYEKRGGVCFESQFYPNSCNTPDFPSSALKAGEEFSSATIYRFTVVK